MAQRYSETQLSASLLAQDTQKTIKAGMQKGFTGKVMDGSTVVEEQTRGPQV